MKVLSTEEVLLGELEDNRWLILKQLADQCEERGDEQGAKGWGWLANNKKWPRPLKGRRYGWLFTNDFYLPQYEHALPNARLIIKNCPKTNKSLITLFKKTVKVIGFWASGEGKPLHHVNGNRFDCSLKNLKWVSPKENR